MLYDVEVATIDIHRTPVSTLNALRGICEWADELHLGYAWCTSANGTAEHWDAIPLEKVRRALLGIHFAQTEPFVLRKFRRLGVLKIVDDTAGVFHPKLIIGTKAGEARALFGSSNLTVGGFAGNTELNTTMSGTTSESPLSDLIEFFDAQWIGPRAEEPDSAWLADYEHAWQARPKPKPVRRTKNPAGESMAVTLEQLTGQWIDYYELIKAQERRELARGGQVHVFDNANGSWLQEVENCNSAFGSLDSFANMPIDERKLIAGTGGKSRGYLGSMKGAGFFKQLVNTAPATLSRGLQIIPQRGDVSNEAIERFFETTSKIEGVGFGVATRLLTVKRPDLFISVNKSSRGRIKEVFGRAPATPTAYLALLRRIWAMPWYLSTRPNERNQQRVWDARVALLDAVMYERH